MKKWLLILILFALYSLHAGKNRHHKMRQACSAYSVTPIPLLQYLGQEAQIALRIPDGRRSPILIDHLLEGIGTPYVSPCPAYASTCGIFINQRLLLADYTLGALRHLLHHEATHRYFGDAEELGYLMHQCAASDALLQTLIYHQELRADTVAADTCACEICLLEAACIRTHGETCYLPAIDAYGRPCLLPMTRATTDEGYLTQEGLLHKAGEYSGYRCPWHRHVPQPIPAETT